MCSKLRRANRNKNQTFRPRNSDPADLNWLPVKDRIQYKIAVVVYKALTTQEPNYTRLTSSGSMFHHVIYVPATEAFYRSTAPTSSTPTARSLKPHPQFGTIYHNRVLSDLSNLTSFKRLLKTELDNRAYHR